MTKLCTKQCVPCEGGVPALSADEAAKLGKEVPLWTISLDIKTIHRDFNFNDFHQTMAFVNALAWIAHGENHHPDLEVHYSSCRVLFTTHAIGGLSENDFICAAKIDKL